MSDTPKHCMLDLETFSEKSNALITSISAVVFTMDGEIHDEFEVHIDIESSLASGFTISKGTLLWWLEQSEEAKNLLVEGQKKDSVQVMDALQKFSDFYYKNRCAYIWGNSAKFDLGKLQAYYERFRKKTPWITWNELCYRTECAPFSSIKKWFKDNFEGIPHYGIDDCKSQVKTLVHINNTTKRWR